tara:strand:- start:570 stop:707 length:138 start_codon:yes stop_codon:yes gene_type:complete
MQMKREAHPKGGTGILESGLNHGIPFSPVLTLSQAFLIVFTASSS